MRKAYFVMENWEEEWIDTAVYLLENLWQRHYQSKVWTAAVSLAASASAKPVCLFSQVALQPSSFLQNL